MSAITQKRIREVILNMERPFRISDLFIRLEREGITDRVVILEQLDVLCEAGLVNYAEIDDYCWAYTSILSIAG